LRTQRIDDDLLQDVDTVFHLAGIAHQEAALEEYELLNVQATLQLAEQALSAGVRCFVFMSSVKAMGEPSDAGPRSELDCELPVEPYGLSKWRAECALKERLQDEPMSLVILRPALIYGVGVKGNLATLASAVKRGMPRPPAVGARSMIALDDLVLLLHTIGQVRPPGIHTWIATGGGKYSTRDVYDCMREALGRKPGVSWLPLWAWRFGAKVLDALRSKRGDNTFSSTAEKIFGTELYSNAAILAALSWRPTIELSDEVSAMLRPTEERL